MLRKLCDLSWHINWQMFVIYEIFVKDIRVDTMRHIQVEFTFISFIFVFVFCGQQRRTIGFGLGICSFVMSCTQNATHTHEHKARKIKQESQYTYMYMYVFIFFSSFCLWVGKLFTQNNISSKSNPNRNNRKSFLTYSKKLLNVSQHQIP